MILYTFQVRITLLSIDRQSAELSHVLFLKFLNPVWGSYLSR